MGRVGSTGRLPVLKGVGYLTINARGVGGPRAGGCPSGAIIARVNVPERARRLTAAWYAFLEAETTAIESVAVRRIRRAYRKKLPEWRQEWDRLLREQYAVERRLR
jgi:hypothetical protein